MASENYFSSSSEHVNSALTPTTLEARVFHWHTQASLWFSLGVGLLVIQLGSYLSPALGTRDAMLAIVIGSIVGAGLLAWTAHIGARTGLSSAGIMHHTFGSRFARLPVLLNIVQLIGWTTFELVIMRDGSVAIAKEALGWDASGMGGTLAFTALWGGVLSLLLLGSMVAAARAVRWAAPGWATR